MEDGHKRVCIEIVSEDTTRSLGIEPLNSGWFVGNANEAKPKVASCACVPDAVPNVNDGIK